MKFDFIPRSQIDELLFQLLKCVYHWEGEVHARFGLTCQEIYPLQHLCEASPARLSDLAVESYIPEHE